MDHSVSDTIAASEPPHDVPVLIIPPAYHIHEYHVTGNSECATTGGHLGPYNATESPPCDRKNKATCQVGDLAGKHGNLSISEPTFK